MKKNSRSNVPMMQNESRIRERRIRFSHPVIAVLLALLLLSACSSQEASHNDTYTCPMHPTVISDRPGTCPVCGMDLVRKARPGEEIEITEDLSRLMKSPNEVVVASVKTIRPEYKSVPVVMEATGIVTYDTRNVYTIAARVSGRLDEVLLKYNFQPVKKGQKVAAIYSPELVTAQRELLFLIEHDPSNEPLLRAAKDKLALLGLTSAQISQVISSKAPQNIFGIFSPYDGYVAMGTAPAAPASGMTSSSTQTSSGMGDMGDGATAAAQTPSTNTSQEASGSLPREGSYVTAGETLFTIVNNAALRIELDLPAADASAITRGDSVRLTVGQQNISASVDFIQPFYAEGESFVKLRLYTDQSHRLQIGQLVKASIGLHAQESLWVPRAAVLDLGTQTLVFIRDKGVLRPKTVSTGIRSGGLVEVKSGLASADEIAANAHYLVDSESFIKPVD